MMRNLLIVLAVFAALSCAGCGPSKIEMSEYDVQAFPSKYSYNAPYDKVWEGIIDATKEFDVKLADKESGIVQLERFRKEMDDYDRYLVMRKFPDARFYRGGYVVFDEKASLGEYQSSMVDSVPSSLKIIVKRQDSGVLVEVITRDSIVLTTTTYQSGLFVNTQSSRSTSIDVDDPSNRWAYQILEIIGHSCGVTLPPFVAPQTKKS